MWLLDHLDDLANQLPSDDDAKRAADEAVVTTRQAMEAAPKAITDLQLMAVRMAWNDSQIRGALDELQSELDRATTAYEDALARQGSFTPMTDVWERLQRGVELRHKLEMSQPIYDLDGEELAPRPITYDEHGKITNRTQLPDPDFYVKADAEFNEALGSEIRKIIKSITVSPDFPDPPGRGKSPVRLERYKIEAA